MTRRVQAAKFENALRGALPADLADQALDDPACAWLWRSLREAEAAGLDGGQVLRRAVAVRTMTGARDVARVLDSRVRHMLDGVRTQPFRPWIQRIPPTGSADLDRYLHELGQAMDDRIRRLGEHTTVTQPLWARQVLGPVPSDPLARLDWEQRAAVVAAYRERYGHAHPADPIGPAPAKTSPEARAAWQAAMNALGSVDGIDLRGCTDGDLWLRRGTYERETSWAPPHVAEELRLIRIAERDAHVNAIRAEHELRVAQDDQAARRHQQLARIWHALEAKAAIEASMFTAAQETRRQWEIVTEPTRRIAIAADLELRRRHPGRLIPELRPHSAEAEGITYPVSLGLATEVPTGTHRTLDGSERPVTDTDHRPTRNERTQSYQRDADGRRVLGLTPQAAYDEIPEQILRIRQNATIAQASLDDLARIPLPGASEDDPSPGLAWPVATVRERDALLQPRGPTSYPPPASLSAATLPRQMLVTKRQSQRDVNCVYRGIRVRHARAREAQPGCRQAPRARRSRARTEPERDRP